MKLNGKRLFPTSSVKYLGIFLGEHLYWKKQLAHAITKLNQGIDILSKLWHCPNINILKIAYHSLVVYHSVSLSSNSVCIQNSHFTNQIEQNKKIVKSVSKLKYCGDNRNYQTRSATRKLLDTLDMF